MPIYINYYKNLFHTLEPEIEDTYNNYKLNIKKLYIFKNVIDIDIFNIIKKYYIKLLKIEFITNQNYILNKSKIYYFIWNNIITCDECDKKSWSYNIQEVESCADNCCYKYICKKKCNILLNCGCYKYINDYDLKDKYLETFCENCNKHIIQELCWYGLSNYDYYKKYG